MSDQPQAYIQRNPGDMITAEDWNALQTKIKSDISRQVDQAKKDIKVSGVDRADNADKFDNKTPQNWTDDLDKRYAPKVHDHEGQASYRHYYKRLEAGQTIVLEHKLGRFPIADFYELLPIAPQLVGPDGNPVPINDKFYLYYNHEERDRDLLYTRDRATKRWPWGTSLAQMLTEYHVEWEDDDSLGDVVNDFLDAFFNTPQVDEMEHSFSPWIDEHRSSEIRDLKQRDEWPDIRWAVRPFKLVVGHDLTAGERPFVDVVHLSYDTLAIIAPTDLRQQRLQPTPPGRGGNGEREPQPREFLDLMILLRS